MKKFHLLSVILGSCLLLLLVLHIGAATLWNQLGALGWGLIPLVLVEGVADIFHTCGLRRCLSDSLKTKPFFELFFIRMAGTSINYLTPTAGFGGEVTKGALLALKNRGSDAATGVIIDKLSYALSQLFFVLTGSMITLWFLDLPTPVWMTLFLSTGLLAAGLVFLLLIQRYGKLGSLVRWLAARPGTGKHVGKAAHAITEIDRKLVQFYRTRPMDLILSIAWHVLGTSVGIVQTFYFLLLLSAHPSLPLAAAIAFFGIWFNLLSFAFPMDIGVLEATRVISFKIVGLYPAMGLTYGIMLRVEQLFWAGMGLLFYAILVLHLREKNVAQRVASNAGREAEG